MAETKWNNYVEDDPCHGCRFAVRVPDEKLYAPWDRRYRCSNKKRVTDVITKVRIEIMQEQINLHSLSTQLSAANALWNTKDMNGNIDCVDYMLPKCYERVDGQ